MDYCIEKVYLDLKARALFKKHVAAVMQGLWKNRQTIYGEDFSNGHDGFYEMLARFSPEIGSFYYDARMGRHIAWAESFDGGLKKETGRISALFGHNVNKEGVSFIDIPLSGEGKERGIKWALLALALPCPLSAVKAAGKRAPAGPVFTPGQTADWAARACYGSVGESEGVNLTC